MDVGSLRPKELFVYDGTLGVVSGFDQGRVKADNLFGSWNFEQGTKVRRVARIDVTVL